MKLTRRGTVTNKSKSLMQVLEPRLLLSYSQVPDATVVVMHTSLGEIAVQLYNDMPITTANFLDYVNSGAYKGTIFHRVTTQSSDGIGVVQGGGFTVASSGTELVPIATNAPITNEWTANHPNDAGTIAMARTSDPNSATSQFYFNTTDNPSLDDQADGNQYADFGKVIRGMNVVQTIDSLSPTQKAVPATDGEQLNPPVTTSGFVTVLSATAEQLYTINIGHGDAAGDQSVTYVDAAGAKTTISIPGSSATLTMTGDNVKITRRGKNLFVTGSHLETQSIQVDSSGALNTLTIKNAVTSSRKKGTKYAAIGDITVDGSLKAINAPGAALTGNVTITGTVGVLNIYDASGSGTISIGAAAGRIKSLSVKAKFMDSMDFVSQTPISTFTTRQYTAGDSSSHYVEAPSINQMKVAGELAASVYVVSADQKQTPGRLGHITAGLLQTATVEAGTIRSALFGQMTGSAFYSITAFNKNTLGIVHLKTGLITNTSILSVGNIGAIRAGALTGSNIIAGASSETSPLNFPASLGAPATIQRITISKGASFRNKDHTRGFSPSFSQSQIAADHIGKLTIGWINTTPASGGDVGVMADTIGMISGSLINGQKLRPFALSQLDDPGVLSRTLVRNKLVGTNGNPGPMGKFTINVNPPTIAASS